MVVELVVFEFKVIELFPEFPGSHCSLILPAGLLLTVPSPQNYLLQVLVHPSPSTVFPSSHSSEVSITLLPHTGLVTLVANNLPLTRLAYFCFLLT